MIMKATSEKVGKVKSFGAAQNYGYNVASNLWEHFAVEQLGN